MCFVIKEIVVHIYIYIYVIIIQFFFCIQGDFVHVKYFQCGSNFEIKSKTMTILKQVSLVPDVQSTAK